MNGITETVFTICVVLVAVELLCRLVSKSSALQFVRALIVVLLLLSLLSQLPNMSTGPPIHLAPSAAENDELSAYLDASYHTVVRRETAEYVETLLHTIEVKPLNIEALTENHRDGGIVIRQVTVYVQNTADQMRAAALLRNVLDEDTRLEVRINEGA